MDAFRFSPELFEVRTRVMDELDSAGFHWLSHYSSVDPIHDLYGIEVCGIIEKEDAQSIQKLLIRILPHWPYRHLQLKERGREPGYKAVIHRDSPRESESWETV